MAKKKGKGKSKGKKGKAGGGRSGRGAGGGGRGGQDEEEDEEPMPSLESGRNDSDSDDEDDDEAVDDELFACVDDTSKPLKIPAITAGQVQKLKKVLPKGMEIDDIGKNKALLLELVPEHLFISRFDFGEKEDVVKDLILLVYLYRAFTEVFPGTNRGSPSAGTGQLRHRTHMIFQRIPNYSRFLNSCKKRYEKIWKESGKLDPETQHVIITNVWGGKSLATDEHQALARGGRKNMAKGTGTFGKHYDNFRKVSNVEVMARIIATLLDIPPDGEGSGKMMGFDKGWCGNEVEFPVPHGTVIGMDGFASGFTSGPDGEKYCHHVFNAASETHATFTLAAELGIASKDIGDLPSCSSKGDDDIVEEQMKKWKEHWEGPATSASVLVDGGEQISDAEIDEVSFHGMCTREEAKQALLKSAQTPSEYGRVLDSIMSFFPTLWTADDAATPANAEEEGLEAKDIELVMSQTGCTRAEAVVALRENNNNLVNAILSFD